MLSRTALGGIWVYQRYISPRKGYRCAYSVRHGGTGCSGYIKFAIKEHGIIAAIPLIKKRFADCKLANAELRKARGVSMSRNRRSSERRSDRIMRRLEAIACCGTCMAQSACSMPVGVAEAIDGDCGPSDCSLGVGNSAPGDCSPGDCGPGDCGPGDCGGDCGSCS
ncbi:membrane protein insertion efficiency factor YidD [Yoonia sp. BS5-3]|uniref:Membrane protein insertion efficiency factor YidD n=1 Tax=Yoonia phaeophyticola TaxID=3137369 RepID=A0ABZ2UYL6_9RHOB